MNICKKLIEQGVIIIDPSHTYIDETVEIMENTIIYPNTSIRGKTVIGKNNIIDMNTIIIDSEIGDNNSILSSYIEESKIGCYNKIGPFTHIRGQSIIANNVTLGNYVEVKHSIIDDEAKAKHLSYLGDANIGKRVNIGGGTIVANTNGITKDKNQCIILDDAYVGANSVLVSPVVLKRNCLIAAGSVIVSDVEENALAIARSRQINKEYYNKKERKA